MGRNAISLPHLIAHDIVQHIGLVRQLASGPVGIHQILPVLIAENVQTVPPIHNEISGFQSRGQHHLQIGLSGLAIPPGYGHSLFDSLFDYQRNFYLVGGEVHNRHPGEDSRNNVGKVWEIFRGNLGIELGKIRELV